MTHAEEAIRTLLDLGVTRSVAFLEAADAAGIDKDTLYAIRDGLGYRSKRVGEGQGSYFVWVRAAPPSNVVDLFARQPADVGAAREALEV